MELIKFKTKFFSIIGTGILFIKIKNVLNRCNKY